MAFVALFVCTGNICRSPAAELLFRSRIGDLPIVAASAGTYGLVGRDVDVPTGLVLREFGVDPSEHVGRRLKPELIAEADVVLTAAAEHRSSILQAEPTIFRRVFTMREFARLGATLPLLDGEPTPALLRERVKTVAGQRGLVEPGEDTIGDPFGASVQIARQTVQTVSAAVDGVIHSLGLRSPNRATIVQKLGDEHTLP